MSKKRPTELFVIARTILIVLFLVIVLILVWALFNLLVQWVSSDILTSYYVQWGQFTG